MEKITQKFGSQFNKNNKENGIRLESSLLENLFCYDKMRDQYKQEIKTKYEKSKLKIDKIPNGIVHPLQKNQHSSWEANLYGGVTDEFFNLIELSLTKRISPINFSIIFNQWYNGANPNCSDENIDFVDEEVVFLGPLSKHYGHFILEGLSRLWFYLESNNTKYKAVYISSEGEDKFNELFNFFGIKKENILKIEKPTKFKTVIIPEQSIRLHDFYHVKYKETIDRIIERVNPSKYEKVYYSKRGLKSGRAFGEESIENVFLKNGYKVFHPQNLSLYDQISILKGCKMFASTSGTSAHNAIFMNDGATCICLNRSAHFHPIQIMIEQMRGLKSIYVDVFIFSSRGSFADVPCLLAPTRFLFNFYKSKGFSYDKFSHYKKMPKYFIEYIWLSITYWLPRKLIRLVFQMLNSDWKLIRFMGKSIRMCYKKIF